MITTIMSAANIHVGQAVKMNGATCVPVTSSSDVVVGVAVQTVAANRPAAIQTGGKAKVALQNNPAVAQINEVQVVGADDGLYRITIGGVDVDFTASGSTATQIRDGLIAQAIVLELDDDYDITAVSTDTVSIESLTPGTAFTITVTQGDSNLTLTEEQANVASVAFPKGGWGVFNSDGVGVPSVDGIFKSLGEAPATEDGYALVECLLFPAEVAG